MPSANCRLVFTGNVPKNIYPNIKGVAPPHVGLTDVSSEHALGRDVLREGWNGAYAKGNVKGRSHAGTPFRLVNNSGDYLARRNYACRSDGSGCDGSGIQASSCNSAYVYDSSDYIRFKKQQAKNKNYNDYSSGGNANKGSYTALSRVRH